MTYAISRSERRVYYKDNGMTYGMCSYLKRNVSREITGRRNWTYLVNECSAVKSLDYLANTKHCVYYIMLYVLLCVIVSLLNYKNKVCWKDTDIVFPCYGKEKSNTGVKLL